KASAATGDELVAAVLLMECLKRISSEKFVSICVASLLAATPGSPPPAVGNPCHSQKSVVRIGNAKASCHDDYRDRPSRSRRICRRVGRRARRQLAREQHVPPWRPICRNLARRSPPGS